MGAELITVSTDAKSAHPAWQRDAGDLANVKHKMGSDPMGNVSRMFGVYDEATGLALRGTFVISPEGVLLNSEVNFYNLVRNIDELMRRFKANVYMARNTTETCPSKWRDDGDNTLANPGAETDDKAHEVLQE